MTVVSVGRKKKQTSKRRCFCDKCTCDLWPHHQRAAESLCRHIPETCVWWCLCTHGWTWWVQQQRTSGTAWPRWRQRAGLLRTERPEDRPARCSSWLTAASQNKQTNKQNVRCMLICRRSHEQKHRHSLLFRTRGEEEQTENYCWTATGIPVSVTSLFTAGCFCKNRSFDVTQRWHKKSYLKEGGDSEFPGLTDWSVIQQTKAAHTVSWLVYLDRPIRCSLSEQAGKNHLPSFVRALRSDVHRLCFVCALSFVHSWFWEI